MEILALIPARAGSKRVKDKNVSLLGGKPLIAYTVEAALASKLISRVVVSTDSKQIANISKECGAEAPFIRPESISQDDSTEMDFFEHALEWFRDHEGYVPDLIVQLYPTSPFRKAETIDKAIKEIQRYPDAHSLRSVTLCKEHPYKMWVIENSQLKPFVKGKDRNTHTRSYHLLPTVYIQNASIYITKPSTIKNTGTPIGDIVIPFPMGERESIDINTHLDLQFAEMVLTE
ncbi:MAG: N-acylneuraminate cytidylyltransferase [Candidatus Scalindua sp.]|nr:acylneuraminate cytidylyltransferase family protein [Planctomycetota bacterium]GJQ57665.1 MAG: N-acylneuraminate cytidylyltransferase [Candidatus Scalindua sp.]